MRGDLILPVPLLFGFLLTLTRVSGVFVFVPLPGIRNGPALVRAVLASCVTFVLYPYWPGSVPPELSFGRLAGWLLSEAALGITLGLMVAFFLEALQVAGQSIGMQAGYAYASMVDPATEADSSILLVFAQVLAGLFFFSLGLDRDVVRILIRSLEAYPPGTFLLSLSSASTVITLGSDMFTTGLRLAMPAVALLILVDLALALLGRLNQQLQLITLAFPVKMLAALGLLAWLAVLFPRVLANYSLQLLGAGRAMVAP